MASVPLARFVVNTDDVLVRAADDPLLKVTTFAEVLRGVKGPTCDRKGVLAIDVP